jgi:hypothetical protein
MSDSLCEQPRFYEKRLGVYSNIILENINWILISLVFITIYK